MAPIPPIPTLFHTFSVILSMPKASEIDLVSYSHVWGDWLPPLLPYLGFIASQYDSVRWCGLTSSSFLDVLLLSQVSDVQKLNSQILAVSSNSTRGDNESANEGPNRFGGQPLVSAGSTRPLLRALQPFPVRLVKCPRLFGTSHILILLGLQNNSWYYANWLMCTPWS